MKKITKIFAGVALAVIAFASCSKLNEAPVFEEAESFAAFSGSTFNINEDGGKIVIPVNIAAYSTVRTNVSYTILDASLDGSKYTAKNGVDFRDTNTDGVLVFDGTTYTQNIVIEIVNQPGVYTGDITFGIELQSASGLKLSSEKLCQVTIADLDHPLASILGEYTAIGQDSSGSAQSWTVTLTKDPADVHVVHIDYIVKGALDYKSWGDWSYVGTVSDDLKKISVPLGQKTQAWYQSADDVFILKAFDRLEGGSIYGITDSGNLEITCTAPGKWSVGNIWLYPAVTQKYYTNFCNQNITWTKK